jgi:hypothetical protein
MRRIKELELDLTILGTIGNIRWQRYSYHAECWCKGRVAYYTDGEMRPDPTFMGSVYNWIRLIEIRRPMRRKRDTIERSRMPLKTLTLVRRT